MTSHTEHATEKFLIRLYPAPNEAENSKGYQDELRPIAKAVSPHFHQRAYTCDSADFLGYPIGEWMELVPPATVAIVWTAKTTKELLLAWIKARAGRKVVIVIGEKRFEAPNSSELSKSLDAIAKHGLIEEATNHDENA